MRYAIRYFTNTDTLLVQLRAAPIVETRELDDGTMIDLDRNGNICAITMERASVSAKMWALTLYVVCAAAMLGTVARGFGWI